MSYQGHFQQAPEPKKKKRGLRVFLIILVILLVIVIGAVIAGTIYYNKMMNKMNIIELPEDTYVYTEETELTEATEDPTETTEAETTEATTVETTRPPVSADDIVNILVVGQASRAGEESRMADTTMLVSVNTYDGTVTVFSVLRDSYVKLPDYRVMSAVVQSLLSAMVWATTGAVSPVRWR